MNDLQTTLLAAMVLVTAIRAVFDWRRDKRDRQRRSLWRD